MNTRTRTFTHEDLDALLEIGGVVDFEVFIADGVNMKFFVQLAETPVLPTIFANAAQTSRDRNSRAEVYEFLQHWMPVTIHLEEIVFRYEKATDEQKAEWSAWKMRDGDHYQPDASLTLQRRMGRSIARDVDRMIMDDLNEKQ